MTAYGALYREALMPAWEGLVRRRPTLEHLRDLERSQWTTRESLDARQTRDLKTLLSHAYAHVPFYTEAFARARVLPADVRGPADLLRLPLLTREAARAGRERRRSLAPPLPTIVKKTGGSTGQPLTFEYESGSESWRQAVRLRGYSWAGCLPGEPVLHYWGRLQGPLDRTRRLKTVVDRALRREHVVDCGLRSDAALGVTVEWISRYRPSAIVAYCHAAVDLARFITAKRLRDWGTIPVICCAEALLPSDRRVLTEAFGGKVFESYGCREFMLIGMECAEHSGLHVSTENLVVELVVNENDHIRLAHPGEEGEVVVTDLHNLGMPFIRYVTGDRAMWSDVTTCPCGRASPLLRGISGRVTETLRRSDGSLVEGILFNVIFTEFADAVRQFQVVQTRDLSVTLTVVPDEIFTDGQRAEIRARCLRYLGDVPLHIVEADTIPDRPNGKRQVVVVES